jgi:hypothetical protein
MFSGYMGNEWGGSFEFKMGRGGKRQSFGSVRKMCCFFEKKFFLRRKINSKVRREKEK